MALRDDGKKRPARRTEISSDFWVTPDFEDLRRWQGVRPLSNETLKRAPFWPEDLDPEEFLPLIKD
jgi:hypothetical protein